MPRQAPRESSRVSSIMARLRAAGCKVYNNHGSAFSGRGRPDLDGCRPPDGRYFGLEVKRPGEDTDDLQEYELEEIRKRGGIAAKVEDPQEAIDVVFRDQEGVR